MIVAVMGLIGSGKSSLVTSLNNTGKYTVFMEPTKEIEGSTENPFLDKYYENPSRWAYTMQTFLLFERYKQFQEAHYRSLRGEDCIIDSAYYSDFAFALVQQQDGYFTDDEYMAYLNMHQTLQPNLVYPDVIVYLDLSPEDTLNRIKERSRECESNIPLQYLTKLHAAYCKVLSSLSKRCKIVYVDARKSREEVLSDVEAIIDATRDEIISNGQPCYK